jgi:hypothetical protein
VVNCACRSAPDETERGARVERPTSATPSVHSPAPPPSAAGRPPEARRTPLDRATFARLFDELSEPDRYFFSDNFVSNETSYLQVAPLLETRARKGGAYVGVGPEQNFTYIALIEPELAFIVDIRRQNALEHLLYKALFDRATSRGRFLTLLIGVAAPAAADPGPNATIEELLSFADDAWKKRDKKSFQSLHAELRQKITGDYGIQLGKRDLETLENVHEAFFTRGLDLKFELHGSESRRDYPALRALLGAAAPDGRKLGFLASEAAFRKVQELERQNRIIPVVGDFAGTHALMAIGSELAKRDLPVSVLYTSNVEQYVIEPPSWQSWVKNLDALPSNEQSLFLRCYLDQGRRHPQQLPGHRTASVLQSFDQFRWRQRTRGGYTGFWQLVTDGVLGAESPGPAPSASATPR